MRRLRAECPWKAAQTHRSLARYLLEETHESARGASTPTAARRTGRTCARSSATCCCRSSSTPSIAEQDGEFTTGDVAADITEKMRRRNPHVFGEPADRADGSGLDPAGVNELWEARKAEEKQRSSVTDGLPPGLPALLHADKVLDRLGAYRRARRRPTADDPDLGERLLALVAEARRDGVDPEQALRDAVRRRLP